MTSRTRRSPSLRTTSTTTATVAAAVLVALAGPTAYRSAAHRHDAPAPRRTPAPAVSASGMAGTSTASAALYGSHARSRLFRISGRPSGGLAPGLSEPLDLRLANPHTFAVSVTRLTVLPRSVRAPRADRAHPCSRRDFSVTPLSGHRLRLRPRSSARLSRLHVPRARRPRVRMLDRPVNQDGCKGAVLRLSFAGTGRR